MKPIPNFAKAAAVLTFTSGIKGPDQALEIYEELVTTGNHVWSVLDKHGATRWSPVDNLDLVDWLGGNRNACQEYCHCTGPLPR